MTFVKKPCQSCGSIMVNVNLLRNSLWRVLTGCSFAQEITRSIYVSIISMSGFVIADVASQQRCLNPSYRWQAKHPPFSRIIVRHIRMRAFSYSNTSIVSLLIQSALHVLPIGQAQGVGFAGALFNRFYSLDFFWHHDFLWLFSIFSNAPFPALL